jgi:hypothetical protein
MTTHPTERSNARGGSKLAKRHQDAVKHSWLLGWVRHLVVRFRLWICDTFGHSFSDWDVLRFKIECEGQCYTVNTLTGKRRPRKRKPKIKCQRCGKVQIVGEAH